MEEALRFLAGRADLKRVAGDGTMELLTKMLALSPPEPAAGRLTFADALGLEEARPLVFVLGATGAGKSSLIAQISGQAVEIGHGLEPCTRAPAAVKAEVGGQKIYLVDTPGFGGQPDGEPHDLLQLAAWLAGKPEEGCRVAGVLLMYAANVSRVRESMRAVYTFFAQSFGKELLPRTAVITTHWDQLAPQAQARGAAHEEELLRLLCRDALAGGGSYHRLVDAAGARDFLARMLGPEPQPQPLPLPQLQKELTLARLPFVDTTLGCAVVDAARSRWMAAACRDRHAREQQSGTALSVEARHEAGEDQNQARACMSEALEQIFGLGRLPSRGAEALVILGLAYKLAHDSGTVRFRAETWDAAEDPISPAALDAFEVDLDCIQDAARDGDTGKWLSRVFAAVRAARRCQTALPERGRREFLRGLLRGE